MERPSDQEADPDRISLKRKARKLEEIIVSLKKVVIAYSGGVDSTLLLSMSREILGDQVLAITASSEIIPQKEIEEAKELAKKIGVRHQIIFPEPMRNSDFVANTAERCYYCKYQLCARLNKIAEKEGAFFVADGTNQDDTGDYRPGKKAASEWGMRSPLLEADLSKNDIRMLSKVRDLPTWNRPSKACLASRIPYGREITVDRLRRVEQAEEIITGLGARQIRVRLHDDNTARIEVDPEEISRLLGSETRSYIVNKLQDLGFIYITVDLKGYQTGSVNEVLKEAK